MPILIGVAPLSAALEVPPLNSEPMAAWIGCPEPAFDAPEPPELPDFPAQAVSNKATATGRAAPSAGRAMDRVMITSTVGGWKLCSCTPRGLPRARRARLLRCAGAGAGVRAGAGVLGHRLCVCRIYIHISSCQYS